MFGWFGVAKVPHRGAKMKYRLVPNSMPNGYAVPSGTERYAAGGITRPAAPSPGVGNAPCYVGW